MASRLPRRARALVCGLGLALGPGAPAHADAGALARLSLEALLDVEVEGGARYAQRLADVAGLASVVTAEDIRAFGWRTLGEVLRALPGVGVTYDRNYTYAGLRGLSRPGGYNDRLLVLVDGQRANDNVYGQAHLGSEFLVDTDLIERVELVPGPVSVVYGTNAFSGVVNVVTRRPAQVAGTRLAASYGSARAGEASASWARAPTADAPGVLVQAGGFDTRGRDLAFPAFGGTAHGLDGDRGARGLGKVEWASGVLLLAAVTRTKDIPTASFGQVFDQPGASTTDRRLHASLVQHWAPAAGVDVEGTLVYADYRYEGRYAYVGYRERDQARGRWIDAGLKALVTTLPGHRIVAGLDLARDLAVDQHTERWPSGAAIFDDRRRGAAVGVYVQDEVDLADGWRLHAGLRRDHYESGDATSPRFALLWQAAPSTTLKLVHGTAFRAPNAYELAYEATGTKAPASLDAERIRSTEFVVEHYPARDARVGISLFHSRVRGFIDLSADPADGLLVYVNRSGATLRGAEAEWMQAWDSGLRVRASYAYHDAEDEDGGRLTSAPRHQAKLALVVPLPLGVDAGVEARAMSRRRTRAAEVPGVVVADLTLTARTPWPGLELQLAVRNLFDRRYADPGSAEHVQDAIAQDGRTVRVGFAWRFDEGGAP